MPKSVKLALQFLVTAVVLAWLLRIVPLQDIFHALRTAHPGYVALGLVLQMLMRLPTAIRMKVIADVQELRLDMKTIIVTLFSTSFYGLLLPGTLAGGAATWMKYVQYGARAGPALVSIIINRTLELVTVCIAGISYWIVDRKLSGTYAIVFLVAAFCALLIIYLLLFGRSHYLSLLVQHGARLQRLNHNSLYRKMSAFAQHLARMRELPQRTVVAVLLATIVQDLLGAAALYAFAHALDIQLGFLTVAWMRVAAHMVVMLPVSISGLGVREGTLVLLTAPYGISASATIAWSFLIFAGTLLAAMAGGLVEARALWIRKHSTVAAGPSGPSG